MQKFESSDFPFFNPPAVPAIKEPGCRKIRIGRFPAIAAPGGWRFSFGPAPLARQAPFFLPDRLT
jgi:hypothetical protein